MTKAGLPMQKIAVTNLIFAIATLAAGVVLSITGHQDQANLLFGATFGGAAGATATTIVVARQIGTDVTPTNVQQTPQEK